MTHLRHSGRIVWNFGGNWSESLASALYDSLDKGSSSNVAFAHEDGSTGKFEAEKQLIAFGHHCVGRVMHLDSAAALLAVAVLNDADSAIGRADVTSRVASAVEAAAQAEAESKSKNGRATSADVDKVIQALFKDLDRSLRVALRMPAYIAAAREAKMREGAALMGRLITPGQLDGGKAE